MKDIKLIVSDVDGTLIDHTETVSEDLKQIVKKCNEAGIVFALSTGRTRELADPIIAKLGIQAPCVEANGAYIRHGEACILEHGFSLQPIKDILYTADKMGFMVTLATTETERAVRENDCVKEQRKHGGRYEELLPLDSIDFENDRFQKVMFFDHKRTGDILKIREMLKPVEDLYWITTFSTQAVELGPKGCNKATGIRELAAILGIEMEQVMACGDFWNDFEMVSQAGVGVAVGNAITELKEAADYVAGGCYSEGVVEAIRKYCFGDNHER